MTALFQRRCRVVLGSRVVEGLRTTFKITKTLSKEPNELHLAVYNLSQDSRAALQVKGIPVILEAGYAETTAQIFSGQARTVDHLHEGSDWVTKVQCGDGERAYRWAEFSQSFSAGTPVASVFAAAARATGLDVGAAVAQVQAAVPEQYTQGFSAFGRAIATVDKVLRGRGLEWSIQDGKLQVLSEGEPLASAVVELSADSGLIGSPEHGPPHQTPNISAQLEGGVGAKPPPVLKAKALLNAALVPGGRVSIKAHAIEGLFRISRVEHEGDTFGAEWYSMIEASPL